jgi:hypothetical protein
MRKILSRSTSIDKYLSLSEIKSNNVDLFYRLVIDNAEAPLFNALQPTYSQLLHYFRDSDGQEWKGIRKAGMACC